MKRSGVWRSTRRWRAAGLVFLCLTFVACVPKYDPFKIPVAELRSRVQTIAISPLSVDLLLVDEDYARAQIEPLIIERLEAGGFKVLPSEHITQLWARAATDVGGIFDPVSGEINKERYEAVRTAVNHELHRLHGVDAVLYVSLLRVDLYATGAKVAYCGGPPEEVYWQGSPLGMFETTTMVYALCLNIGLYDLEERLLYGIRYPLEIVETYFRQTRAVRPLQHRLRNPVRISNAVEATVGPLAGPGRRKTRRD